MLQERLEIVNSLNDHIRDNVTPLLKPVEKCWQANDFLPESSDPDFLDKVRPFQFHLKWCSWRTCSNRSVGQLITCLISEAVVSKASYSCEGR